MTKHLHLKPRLLALIIALFMGASGTANLFAQSISQGAVSGHAFTVNADGDQVLFSQGNLQYIGSASTPCWKFADNQWDYLSTTTGQNSSNENVDRDLFGWGTSGYNHGATCYQPWSTSTTNSQYYAYGSSSYNLFDQTGQADWGYNAISNGGNTENSGWRTLTKDEWVYLFNTRSTTSGIRYAKAKVNNVNGVVLLPDDWSGSYYTLNSTNTSDANYTSNTITASQWNTLEQHGAVFLPAAGYRGGTSVYEGSWSLYWSASKTYSPSPAYGVGFYDGNLYADYSSSRYYGFSVRLVCPAEQYSFSINATPNPAEGGTVSGGGAYAAGAECTLSATPSAGYTFFNWMENGTVVSTNVSYNFTVYNERNLVANFVQEGNITFADANVKTLCVTNWDNNNDGELSYAEAAVVTSLGNVFKNDTTIQSFTELEYFISLGTIGQQAFYGCTALTQVTIPNSVNSIGHYAFSDCSSLTGSLVIPNSVTTIGKEAFSGCTGFTGNLTIGNSVTTIEESAFLNCTGFTGSLVIPSSVTTIGQTAFAACSGFTGSLVIPNSVTTIEGGAFFNCSGFTGSLVIPNSMTTIDNGAFRNCSGFTGSLTIGNSVTTIGNYAFSGCSGFTGSLVIPNSVTTIGVCAFSECSGFTGSLVIPNSVTTIGNSAFYNCSGFTGSLTIGNSVTTIGVSAFSVCSGFTGSLVIPNSVTTIDNGAFRNCSGFTGSLVIPNSVTSIGGYAFSECSGFTGSLTIGNSVTTIGNYAFSGCSGFTGSLVIPNSVTTINQYAFSGCSGFDGSLVIPNSVTTIHDYAFYGCSGFTGSLVIPNSVTTIDNYAFGGCSGFTGSLVIPNSVTTIGNFAFLNCSGFTGSLVIPNSVTSIGGYAFSECSGFTGSLVIPNSVTTIGNFAFLNCSGFTGSLVIPNSVTTIGNFAFDGCSGFTGSLVIPNSVTSIGAFAFRNCSGFTGSLVIPNSVTTIGNYAFSGCSGFTGSLTIGNSVTTINQYAFLNCSGFTGSLVIPNSVTTISEAAFTGCSGFTGSLVIPNSVTTIDNGAFRNCSGFTGSLVIPNSVTTINQYAFSGCSGFNGSLVIPNSVTTINKYAFQNCSGFTALIVERQNPATAQSSSFQGMNYSIPFHVPYGKISTYQSTTGWSNFTNWKEQYQFEELDDDLWSDDINWYQGVLPSASDVVCLISNCHLDVDANVLHLYVQNPGDVFTVNSGKTLTGGVNTRLSSQLVIAEGGQLVNYYSNGSGTVQRQISGYGTGNDGWYTIAAPIYGGMPVSGLTTGTYDLYYYDEPTHYWMNVKLADNNFTTLNPAQGYLYANQSPKTVNLAGQLNASNAEISIPVSYTAGELAGFNLVGNPYTNNISIGDVKINGTAQTAFYRAEGGSNLLAYVAADNEPIKPGDGFFVKATEDGTLTFGSTQTRGEDQQDSYVRLVLRKNNSSTGSETVVADRAYLRMNEGERLEKMCTSTAHSLLYFENGGSRYAVANNEAVNGVMPLFLEKANGTYSIEATLLNAECDYLHLVDNMTGKDIDLLETPVYSFEAKTTDYASRFNLVFDPESHNNGDADESFAFISDGNIILNAGPSTGSGTSILQVFDVLGRQVFAEELSTVNYQLSTVNYLPGVYVLRLINGDSVRTQKIVIK